MDLRLSFRAKPINRMLVELGASYAIKLDQHFFYNKSYEVINPLTSTSEHHYSNLFTAEHADMQHLNVAANINYSLKEDYNIYLFGKYNYYRFDNSSQNAWYMPTWEIGTGIDFNPIKELSINADLYYGIGYKCKVANLDGSYNVVNLNDRINLNLGAAYTLEERFTIFAKVNNILTAIPSLRYQDWYGYKNFGYYALLGVKVNF